MQCSKFGAQASLRARSPQPSLARPAARETVQTCEPGCEPLSPGLTLIRPECYSFFDGLKNTAIQPVRQLGKTLFAPSGT
jgi:hypothetical protein